MRILLATDNYPPFIGGAQIQSQLIAQELRERGHDVLVATVWQYDMPDVEDDHGVTVHRLRQLRTLPLLARRGRQHSPPFPDPVTAWELRRLITRFDPDVVHSYGWLSYSCAFALIGRDTPLLLTARDYAYSCATRNLLYRGRPCSGPALMKCLGCAGRNYGVPKGWLAALGVRATSPLLKRNVRAMHSVSTYVQTIMRRDFLDDRIAKPRGYVIHDVIGSMRVERASPTVEQVSRARLEELPSEPFLLFVGGLRRLKGVEVLIAAYRQLTDPPPLVLIGTIERDSPPDFPPDVHVVKDVPHAAVMEAWERCLFAVLPSIWPEPFGTVVCEAMSRGKAVIGTKPGGHTDMIIDDVTGLVVPGGDVAALAGAMRRLIEDTEFRERLGAAARERAKLFTAEYAIPRLEQLYEELLEAHTRAS